MKKIWKKYYNSVMAKCLQPENYSSNTLDYWQNRLFAQTMLLLIPLILITVIPGVIFSIHTGLPQIAVLDLMSFGLLLYIAIGKVWSLMVRKFMLIICIYLAAIYLLLYIGNQGPGIMFLYCACVFGNLVLPVKFSYLWSGLNLLVCIIFGLILYYNLSPVEIINSMGIEEWTATSANVIFLSFLTSALLPVLFRGLSGSFKKQSALQESLQQKQASLENLTHELEEKNSDLEHFVYAASHDLQEPLRMINGFLTRLESKYHDQLDEKGKQYIHFAVDGASRMKDIIMNLLEFSRIGRSEVYLEKLDLNEVLNEVLNLLQESIKRNDAQIEVKNLPEVQYNHIVLIQIFQNLLTNAMKFHKAGEKPKILVQAEELENEWQLSVKDEGIGIDKKFHEKIFTIFERLHSNSEYEGTGIGLAMVKKNVEILGGRIWVKSKIDEGSTFCFTILK